MEIRVLGPLEVLCDGRPLPLGGRRARSVLAVLVAMAGRVVPTDQLIEEIWGDNHPRTAVDTLQSYLSRLRHLLDPDLPRGRRSGVLVTHRAGYELRVPPEVIDAHRFESAVARARGAIAGGDHAGAGSILRTALGLWRGRALDDLDSGPVVRAEAGRLEDLRLTAVEERVEADLALGLHGEVIGQLQAFVDAHPLREDPRRQLMLALYRAGRQAEALDVFTEGRRALVESLGVEPGPRLQQLQCDILAQNPHLEWTPAKPATTTATASDPVRGAADDEPEGNLAGAIAPFVGRDQDRAAVAGALQGTRLVTVTGTGGIGKTRLALRVAADTAGSSADAIWVVELDTVADGGTVAGATASALGIALADPEAATAALADHFRRRRALLVLDNCEHVLDGAAALVERLLAASPGIRVLATSQQPLGIPGERVYPLSPLGLPPPETDHHPATLLAQSEAVRLFVEKAQSVRPGFAVTTRVAGAVARVCRAVDGVPLALELAAARLRLWSVEELADRLDGGLCVLGGGPRSAPARHHKLESALEWSYRRLAPDERDLLSQLSVFHGGFTFDAAEAVCSSARGGRGDLPDRLDALVTKSQVEFTPTPTGPARHRLLAPTRSYASARLPSDERPELLHRHAAYYTELAQLAGPRLTGPDQVEWLNRLHAEQDNLRAALTWSLEAGFARDALSIAGAVWWFWLQFGHVSQGFALLERALQAVDAHVPSELRQQALYAAGTMASARAEIPLAGSCLQESLEIARANDDVQAVTLSLGELALVESATRNPTKARQLVGQSLQLANGACGAWVHGRLLEASGSVAMRERDLQRASEAFLTGTNLYREAGDEWSACLPRLGAARVARHRGQDRRAVALHRENLAQSMELTVTTYDFVGLGPDVQELGLLASRLERHELAVLLLGASDVLRAVGEAHASASEERERHVAIATAHAAIGGRRVKEALRRGRSLTPANAVGQALESAAALS